MGFQMESEIKRVTEIAENLPKFDWIAAQNEPVGFFFLNTILMVGGAGQIIRLLTLIVLGGGGTGLWGFN